MSVPTINSFLNMPVIPAGADQTRQKSPSLGTVRTDFDDIREKGLTAWAHEQKMAALKARIREDLLKQQGLTEDGVAAMPESQRSSVEAEIARLVEERMQQAMEAQVEEAAKGGKTEGVFLNIMA